MANVPFEAEYSVGDWLRAVAPLLQGEPAPNRRGRPPASISGRSPKGWPKFRPSPTKSVPRPAILSPGELLGTLRQDDPATAAKIDTQNPVRVRRAWGGAARHRARIVGLAVRNGPRRFCRWTGVAPLVLDAERDWLNARIEQRFDTMLEAGALEEARANLPPLGPSGRGRARPSARRS